MSRVGRLAGALLAQTGSEFYLVGDLKEPCDFPAAGFETPAELPGRELPFVRLVPLREVQLSGPTLQLGLEGEALAAALHARFVIARNGSVSNRLWRLVTTTDGEERQETQAHWLGEIPQPVWELVREAVLRCS